MIMYFELSSLYVCVISNSSTHTREGEIQIVEEIAIPFHTLYIDHFGPLQETEDGYKHITVVVHAFSRFTWLFATKSTGSREIMNHLNFLFSSFGNRK